MCSLSRLVNPGSMLPGADNKFINPASMVTNSSNRVVNPMGSLMSGDKQPAQASSGSLLTAPTTQKKSSLLGG